MTRLTGGVALALLLATATPLSAYSVMAHEAAIDVTWDTTLRPLLLRRYPHSSPEALVRARSFAYGGAVIQDLGYYPLGSKFFSNLVHYVRSGDFVEALIREARDVDELAFALGALAHHSNDTTGHPVAVNVTVPMAFPKLRRKYGDVITYAEAPHEHVIIEFSFDIVNAAGGAYLPETYKRFIGFRVATPLLERAFRATYGLEMSQVFADEDRAISTYRYSVSQIIPALTAAAWRDKQDEIAKITPAVERGAFVFAYRRADFERDYGRDYERPGIFARFIGIVYRIVPKIGPLRPLAFKAPSKEAEALFARSFSEATSRFRAEVRTLGSSEFRVRNTDFDTGRPSAHGEYPLADETYAELLDRLSGHGFEGASAALTRNILAFYGAHPRPSPASRKERKRWARVESALRDLENRTLAAGRHPASADSAQ